MDCVYVYIVHKNMQSIYYDICVKYFDGVHENVVQCGFLHIALQLKSLNTSLNEIQKYIIMVTLTMELDFHCYLHE